MVFTIVISMYKAYTTYINIPNKPRIIKYILSTMYKIGMNNKTFMKQIIKAEWEAKEFDASFIARFLDIFAERRLSKQ